jgi:hypothetical protein
MDAIDEENQKSDCRPQVLKDIIKSESVDQEKLLNSTFSGVDLGMVHNLLDTQSNGKNLLKTLNKVNMSTHSNEILNNSGTILEKTRNSIDKRSNMETEEVPSQKMEFDGMRDHVDSSKNAVKSVSENDRSIKNDTFYETSGHVFDCYIENDISGMHNVDLEPGETIFSSLVDDVTKKKFDNGTDNTDNDLSGVYRKSDKKFRVLEESVKRIVRNYPLISEFEICEHLKKETDGCSNMKLDKKGIVKILKRLKLKNSYERFRYFVKA